MVSQAQQRREEQSRRRRDIQRSFGGIESQLGQARSQLSSQERLLQQRSEELIGARQQVASFRVPQRTIQQQFSLGSSVFQAQRQVPIVKTERRKASTRVAKAGQALAEAREQLESERQRVESESKRIGQLKQQALREASDVGVLSFTPSQQNIPEGFAGFSTPQGEGLVEISSGRTFTPIQSLPSGEVLFQSFEQPQQVSIPKTSNVISDKNFLQRGIDFLKGVTVSPTREEIIQREQTVALERQFKSIPQEDLLALSKTSGTGVTQVPVTPIGGGQEFLFTPTKEQQKQAREEAVGEFGKLTKTERIQARTAEFGLTVPRLGIGLAEFGVGFSASGFGSSGIIRETDEGFETFTSFDVGEKVIGKIPGVEGIKSRKVGLLTKGSEIGAIVLLTGGSAIKQSSKLRASGLTKGEALGELVRGFAPVKFSKSRFVADEAVTLEKAFEVSSRSGSSEIIVGEGQAGTKVVGFQRTGKPTIELPEGVKVTSTKDVTTGFVATTRPFIEIRGGRVTSGTQLDVTGIGAIPIGKPIPTSAILGSTGIGFPKGQKFSTVERGIANFEITSEGITGTVGGGSLRRGTGLSAERQLRSIRREDKPLRVEDVATAGTSRTDIFVGRPSGRITSKDILSLPAPKRGFLDSPKRLRRLSRQREKIASEFFKGFKPETLGVKRRIVLEDTFGTGIDESVGVGTTFLKQTKTKIRPTPSLAQQVQNALKTSSTKARKGKVSKPPRPLIIIPTSEPSTTLSSISRFAGKGLYERTDQVASTIPFNKPLTIFGTQGLQTEVQGNLFKPIAIDKIVAQPKEKSKVIFGTSSLTSVIPKVISRQVQPITTDIPSQLIVETPTVTQTPEETPPTRPITRGRPRPRTTRQRLVGFPRLGLPRLKGESFTRRQRFTQKTSFTPSLTGTVRFNVLGETITRKGAKAIIGLPVIRGVITKKRRKKKSLKRKKK